MAEDVINKLDDLENRLSARFYSIQVNINFGEQFVNYQSEGDSDYKKNLRDSIEQQERYKKDVNEMRQRVQTFQKHRVDQDDVKLEEKLLQAGEHLLADERLNTTLTLINEHRLKNNLDLDSKISDFDESVVELSSRTETENINIVILGKRGAGKSSFINTIFGVDNFDPNAIPTGSNECTLEPKAYTASSFVHNNNVPPSAQSANILSDKFVIWDYPGVGTHRFPISEYQVVIPILPVDAYIYLYDGRLAQYDVDLVSKIKNKIVFLVRTKADTIFDVFKFIRDDEDENDELVRKRIDDEWQRVKTRTRDTDPSIQKQLENLDDDLVSTKFYMISCQNEYREFYDFALLMSDLAQKIPGEKIDFLIMNLKLKSSAWFLLKAVILQAQISTWIPIILHEMHTNGVEAMCKAIIKKIIEIGLIFGIEPNLDAIGGIIVNVFDETDFSNQLSTIKNFIVDLDLSTVCVNDSRIANRLGKIYQKRLLKKYAGFVNSLEELFTSMCNKCFKNSIGHVLSTNVKTS